MKFVVSGNFHLLMWYFFIDLCSFLHPLYSPSIMFLVSLNSRFVSFSVFPVLATSFCLLLSFSLPLHYLYSFQYLFSIHSISPHSSFFQSTSSPLPHTVFHIPPSPLPNFLMNKVREYLLCN